MAPARGRPGLLPGEITYQTGLHLPGAVLADAVRNRHAFALQDHSAPGTDHRHSLSLASVASLWSVFRLLPIGKLPVREPAGQNLGVASIFMEPAIQFATTSDAVNIRLDMLDLA